MYLLTDRWIFKVMEREDLERQMKEVRMSALDTPSASIEPQPKSTEQSEMQRLPGKDQAHFHLSRASIPTFARNLERNMFLVLHRMAKIKFNKLNSFFLNHKHYGQIHRRSAHKGT